MNKQLGLPFDSMPALSERTRNYAETIADNTLARFESNQLIIPLRKAAFRDKNTHNDISKYINLILDNQELKNITRLEDRKTKEKFPFTDRFFQPETYDLAQETLLNHSHFIPLIPSIKDGKKPFRAIITTPPLQTDSKGRPSFEEVTETGRDNLALKLRLRMFDPDQDTGLLPKIRDLEGERLLILCKDIRLGDLPNEHGAPQELFAFAHSLETIKSFHRRKDTMQAKATPDETKYDDGPATA